LWQCSFFAKCKMEYNLVHSELVKIQFTKHKLKNFGFDFCGPISLSFGMSIKLVIEKFAEVQASLCIAMDCFFRECKMK
jgi:hypothetical protein